MTWTLIILTLIIILFLWWLNRPPADLYSPPIIEPNNSKDKPIDRPKYRIVLKPRKTFFHGILSGKYYADVIRSEKEKLFEIKLYEARIDIMGTRMEKDGPIPTPIRVPELKIVLPEETMYRKSSEETDVWYKLKTEDHKFYNIELSKVVEDSAERFGTVTGDVYGYILDFVAVREEIIYPQEPEPPADSGPIITGDTFTRDTLRGRFTSKGIRNSSGVVGWSPWEKEESVKVNIWNLIGQILLFLFGLLLFIGWIFTSGWRGLLFVAGIMLIYWLASILYTYFFRILRFLMICAGIAFMGLFIYFLSQLSSSERRTRSDLYVSNDSLQQNVQLVRCNDTMVCHRLTWIGFDKKWNSALFAVTKSSISSTQHQHARLATITDQLNGIGDVYSSLNSFDMVNLSQLLTSYDSLMTANNLQAGSLKFAELIVSGIQQIPYTLVLDGACDANQYTDPNIRNILKSGTDCLPNIPFGVLSPIEFFENLKGDCDTRALYICSILKHYGYDVVILGSDSYGHAMLGIAFEETNLIRTATYGASLRSSLTGKKYYFWETTAPWQAIGQLAPEMSDLSQWYILYKPS